MEKILLMEEEIKKAQENISLVKETFSKEIRSLTETSGLSLDIPIR